jgi:hypothetical protein
LLKYEKSSVFLVLENEATKNKITYSYASDAKILRKMDLGNNAHYSHHIKNNAVDVKRWAKEDKKNGYTVTFDKDKMLPWKPIELI